MTWDGHPDTVSKGAQKNHSAFLAGLKDRFGESWIPDQNFYKHTIAKAILYKSAQNVVRKAKLQSYGANVVTYMVAKLAAKYGNVLNLDDVWEAQSISSELTALFADWAPRIHDAIVETAEKRNVTEWCKKEACWEAIRSLELSIPEALPPEFEESLRSDADKIDQLKARSGGADEDLAWQCTVLNAGQWAAIMLWVASENSIDEFDRKVAHTLSGYAMDGWHRQPSDKQAVRGARVVAAARIAGVID